MIEQLSHFEGWRIAAVAGAALAAVAYVQSESKTDEGKSKSVFSSQLIEPAVA